MEVPQKTKNRAAIWSSNPTPGHITGKDRNSSSRRYMHPYVHCSIIYSCQAWKQPKCPSTEEWIKKMWYLYTVEYYSAIKKNEIMPLAATWMDLEIVILNEVSQTKTNIIWYHLYVEPKKWHKWTYLQNRSRLTERTCGCQGGNGGGIN